MGGTDKTPNFVPKDKGMGDNQDNESLFMSMSLNYIKNKTGEILLFKTGR